MKAWKDMTPAERAARETQGEMNAKHGTPDQFEAAVWRAQADGFVTTKEAYEAVRKYKSDYNSAPRG